MSQTKIPRIKEGKKFKRGSRRLLYLLVFFFMIVFVVLFFRSSISKVTTIEVLDNHFVDAELIGQALGVREGDSFFFTSAGTMEKRLSKLSDIKIAHVRKHFPGKVEVRVEEYVPVAYELNTGSQIELLLANGHRVGQDKLPKQMLDVPIISGWDQLEELKLQLCEALEQIPNVLLSDISQITPDSLTESYPDRIRMFTRSQFEIITTISYLPGKIKYIRSMTEGREPGVITLLEADSYAPYYSTANSDEETE